MKADWDIFCSVVDNYGDIGVTWRLARQLVAEQEQAVRLWVDDLAAFVRLCPQADPHAVRQWQQGVEVCQWPRPWQPVTPARVVVEAFACTLPAAYVGAIGAQPEPVLWLNLEYLSAEDWVGGCHGLPSLQAGGAQKFFFFPGFTHDTGGLLRERELLAQRQAFQADARAAFLESLGVKCLASGRLVSLFAYENAALADWLQALAADTEPTLLLVPEGRILGDLALALGRDECRVGERFTQGALQVQVLPFLPQEAYDRLLWSCDFNAVRGEDSFVRAQWAGRPLLWHIYPQEEGVHWDKLQAFLDLYLRGLSPAAAQALSDLWRAWNAGGSMSLAWAQVLEQWSALRTHAEAWSLHLGEQEDLASRLTDFYRGWAALE
ncbi:MAG: elongation factor P maturation arginine rhamnosyltransferase EarP [Pseudomonadota bacterium]